jgi:tyrosyl-tRNA synthetase
MFVNNSFIFYQKTTHNIIEDILCSLPHKLEGLDGVQKMNKSLDNYIDITEPPQDMFGKLMSVSDNLMFRYFELLSSLDLDEIKGLKDGISGGRIHPKEVKTRLAQELVERFHGDQAAWAAKADFEAQFSRGEVPDEIPEFRLTSEEKTIYLPGVLKESGLVASTSEAR